MNLAEFNQWLADYCLAFPDTAVWLNSCGDKFATLSKWREVFVAKRVTLDEARDATRAMLLGDAERPQAYERETTPAMVVKAVREKRMQTQGYKSDAEVARNIEENKRRRQQATAGNPFEATLGPVLWKMVEGYIERKKAGATQAELDAWLDKADREAFPQSYPRPSSLFEKFNQGGSY